MMIEPRTKSVEAGVWAKLGAGIKIGLGIRQTGHSGWLFGQRESLKANSPKRDKQKTTISIRSDQIDSEVFRGSVKLIQARATKGVITIKLAVRTGPLSKQRGWKER